MTTHRRSAVRGLLAGAAGGLLGTLALDAFQKLALESTRRVENRRGGPHSYTEQQEEQIGNYEAAHVGTAETLASASGASLSQAQRNAAAPVTHYLFGALCGAGYGLLAEFWPRATFGFGTAFGISLQIGASEAVLPALDLMPSPLDTPPLLHAGGFAAHAVYGAATEATRRLLRT